MSRCRGISRRKGGTCASGGAHRTNARCGLSTCVSMEHFSRAPAVIAAPVPVVEHIAPSAAVSYTVPLAVYAVLSACGGVRCACSCGGCSTALCWRAARGPLTNTGKLQDTVSQFWGFSHCQDTLVKTRFVAPILSAPLLTDPRRLTVGPGTREDHDAVQVRDLRRTRRVRGDPGDAWRSRTMTLFRLETFGVPGEYVAFQAVMSLRSFAAPVPVVEFTAPAPAAIAVYAQRAPSAQLCGTTGSEQHRGLCKSLGPSQRGVGLVCGGARYFS